MRIISIGELLWDVIGGTEHLGGAPLNFAVHAARLGHEARFISAVGEDERGRRALAKLAELGLASRHITTVPGQPTGVVAVELDAAGQPRFTIHRPAAYDFLEASEGELVELASWQAQWIYFGTLCQMSPQVRGLTRALIERNPGARCFYDVNLRAGCYTVSLVRELMSAASVIKLNDEEVPTLGAMLGRPSLSPPEFCRELGAEFGWEAACVTRGSHGCVLRVAAEYCEVEGYPVPVADAVGAGDAFAAAFIHGLGEGWPARRIGDFCNRVGALIASRPGAVPYWTIGECEALENPHLR